MECNELLRQPHQLDTEIQHGIGLEKFQWILSTSKKVPSQQVTWSDISIPLPILLHVMTERRKRAFVIDAIRSNDNLIITSTKSLHCEEHCNDIYSVFLIGENQESHLH